MKNGTYWRATIFVDGTEKVSFGESTQGNLLTHAMQMAARYQSVYPTVGIVVANIREHCSGCYNSGRFGLIEGKRGLKRCPDCKGKDAVGRVENFTFCTETKR